MKDGERTYIAIDLKSFYASVECNERGLDSLNTNLVVADSSRTDKTICLAVSPSLKSIGVSGRPRLFEVVQTVRETNAARRSKAGRLHGRSCDAVELSADPGLAVDYIVACPRMAYYIEYSTRIYRIYLRYVAPEDIHVYSVDEVFMDVTGYLKRYGMTPRQLTETIMRDVLDNTGITATAGIGTNMYLAKIAMDVYAKRMRADKNGARIGELNEISYRRELWDHRPITDFWRIGRGYARKLAKAGIYTMGDVAKCSLGGPHDFHNEDLLYRMFGVNAELLIDHAWGWEPCTIAEIKSYKPHSNSVSTGQVLQSPYTFDKARLICREMADSLVLDLTDKGLTTDKVTVDVGYDTESLTTPSIAALYRGEIKTDVYGRPVPKPAHGTESLAKRTMNGALIVEALMKAFDKAVNRDLLVRRMSLAALNIQVGKEAEREEQMSMFPDTGTEVNEAEAYKREQSIQRAILEIKKKFGGTAVIKGMDLEEGATGIERSRQIGGHRK